MTTGFRFSDFNEMFLSSLTVLNKSLIETKTKLAVLAKANVVDAGARGFVLFVEGIIEFITHRNLKELIQVKAETALFEKIEETIPQNVEFRFCTEALIKNSPIDSKALTCNSGQIR